MKQVSLALGVAEQAGIVHRDIKPENIMMTRRAEVKVADFGLAQLTMGGQRLNLTQSGMTMGTPLYMSPEQVSGKRSIIAATCIRSGSPSTTCCPGLPRFEGRPRCRSRCSICENRRRRYKTLAPTCRRDCAT